MLRIRLTPTGKKGQRSYRFVVAEHTAPVKSNFVEILGHYNLARTPREIEVNQDRVKYWISVGAKPSDTVAVLFKNLGMEDMDQYIVNRRDLKRKKKKEVVEEAPKATVSEEAPAEEAPAEEAAVEEAAVEEAAPVPEADVPDEEAVPEPTEETEAPAEEAEAEKTE